MGRDNIAYVHVSYVPYIKMSGEQKTKPTQHSVKELQNIGIQPDVIVCRSDYPIEMSSKKKMSAFCNVPLECIIENITSDKHLEIPLLLEKEGFASVILKKLKLDDRQPDLKLLEEVVNKAYYKPKKHKCKIAIVGKYVDKHNAYTSLKEALQYSAIDISLEVQPSWIASDSLSETNYKQVLKGYDGLIVPAGFGSRGFDGKVFACQYARENDLPCLMMGLGAQAGYIEFARNVAGLVNADSEEFNEFAKDPIVCNGQNFKKGANLTQVSSGTKLKKAYGTSEISLRHRHRYEMNFKYSTKLEKCGMTISGISQNGDIDAFEIKEKKFYVGVAFHPEFSAKVGKPDKLISLFLSATAK